MNWLNKVFNEDVMQTLQRIPDNTINMIFGVPGYDVGINYDG